MICLDSKIKEIIDELGVTIQNRYGLDADGHYIACINTIVLDAGLSEQKRYKTLLHELGHACKHKHKYQLYNIAFNPHSKMEYEAEYFMIENLCSDYFTRWDADPTEINFMHIIETQDIDPKYEPTVKEVLTDYVYNSFNN